ncbi:Protein CLMP1 [Psilocybe cubensis]|nr:Protein CLMP1 [Psilocybe cubensis]KAH9478661.1 Protein CLMP1 [Psilocybe cubensis]
MGHDPITGLPDVTDVHKFFTENFDDADVQELLQSSATKKFEERDKSAPNLDTFDFSALPMERFNFWLITMNPGGLRNAAGEYAYDNNSANVKDHGRQSFQLHCWIKIGPEMSLDVFRSMEEYVGAPPTSKNVEKFIKSSMAYPFPLFRPSLPQCLVLSTNLSPHRAALRPFLDSLPAPFIWRIVPASIENRLKESAFEEGKETFKIYMSCAKEKKEEGNKAYAANDSVAAIACYKDAIMYLDKAFCRFTPENDTTKEQATKLMAVCYANCAAARLLPVDGIVKPENAERAIEDAEEAIHLDKFYPKGYMRLARAYQALGKHVEAAESIAKSLARYPEMENNKGLAQIFNSLKTHG